MKTLLSRYALCKQTGKRPKEMSQPYQFVLKTVFGGINSNKILRLQSEFPLYVTQSTRLFKQKFVMPIVWISICQVVFRLFFLSQNCRNKMNRLSKEGNCLSNNTGLEGGPWLCFDHDLYYSYRNHMPFSWEIWIEEMIRSKQMRL